MSARPAAGSATAVRANPAFSLSDRRQYPESSCGFIQSNRIEPCRQHRAAGSGRCCAVQLCLIAQTSRINAGVAEFDSVTNEPSLKLRGLGLDVELQGELRRYARERLYRTMRRRSQPLATSRQVAIVAVPMQHWRPAERPERGYLACVSQRQRRPADVLDRPRR